MQQLTIMSSGPSVTRLPILTPVRVDSRSFLKDMDVGQAPHTKFVASMISADCWAVGVKRIHDSENIEMLYNAYDESRQDEEVYWSQRETVIENLDDLLQSNEEFHVWMFGDPLTCWGFVIRSKESPSIQITDSDPANVQHARDRRQISGDTHQH